MKCCLDDYVHVTKHGRKKRKTKAARREYIDYKVGKSLYLGMCMPRRNISEITQYICRGS
jgi:hypothetical protein